MLHAAMDSTIQAPVRVLIEPTAFFFVEEISPELCKSCVKATSDDILNWCSRQKEAIIWYDECMLRYSNDSIFSDMVENPVSSSNFFAAEDVNHTVFIRIYGLVQCTPDIMPSDCNICLSNCVSQIPKYAVMESKEEELTAQVAISGNGQISSDIAIAITIPTIFFALFVSVSCYFLRTWRARRKNKSAKMGNVGDEISMMESIQFNLHTIESATNSFSDGNKIGQGGFGSVYKGTLYNGQEVAVKRLSGSSGLEAEEFKNEVALVAKLQHRNLVRLLGFCPEGGEKILIYEFVPNKSLDYFLFDPEKQGLLEWSSRWKIIGGTA